MKNKVLFGISICLILATIIVIIIMYVNSNETSWGNTYNNGIKDNKIEQTWVDRNRTGTVDYGIFKFKPSNVAMDQILNGMYSCKLFYEIDGTYYNQYYFLRSDDTLWTIVETISSESSYKEQLLGTIDEQLYNIKDITNIDGSLDNYTKVIFDSEDNIIDSYTSDIIIIEPSN